MKGASLVYVAVYQFIIVAMIFAASNGIHVKPNE
jgi:hypothetical protein